MAMSTPIRRAHYQAQNGHDGLTARQQRRLRHKENHLLATAKRTPRRRR
jgi:hypothetical protein